MNDFRHKQIKPDFANTAFGKIDRNQFIGIISGLTGAVCYNRFKHIKLPEALAFFSGKRSVSIVTAGITIIECIALFFLWPLIYGGLVAFGTAISSTGAIGVGLYGFFNRLLIPFGLHHALNPFSGLMPLELLIFINSGD